MAPTTKVKAEQFIRSVSDHARKERERLGIDRKDVDLTMGVEVMSRVTYDEHEDED